MDSEVIKNEALALIRQDVQDYEHAVCYVTDRVSFRMRELIKELRRNYWGIFEQPVDENTGRERIWIPLTESIVDAVVKNIDLDTKDMNIRAKKPGSIGYAAVLRTAFRKYLSDSGFGQKLDELERGVAIDGTWVWKTYEVKRGGKKYLCFEPTELLNIYVDPTARSLTEAGSYTERSLYYPDQLREHTDWMDVDVAIESAKTNVSPVERDGIQSANNNIKLIEVYERNGLMPLYLITGNKKDTDMVEGRIIASNAMNGGVVHVIERNTKVDEYGFPIRPCEECWYQKLPNRWYGRGPAEKVINLQVWLNTIVNIRITRSYVAQLGLFKIRKGANISAGMLQRLAVNGAITVNAMDDIQQLPVQEASQASYQDESMAVDWANRTTSVFEAVTGESLPSSTPATNAAIAQRAGQSQFVLIKEQIGMFLQRWARRHVLPFIAEQLSEGEILRLTGEPEELREMDEYVVNKLLVTEIEKMTKAGKFVDADQVMKKKEQLMEQRKAMGNERYIEIGSKSYTPTDYDVEVYVTNEEVDIAVLSQNLMTTLQIVAQNPNTGVDPNLIVRTLFDVMGLDATMYKAKQLPPQMMPQQQGSEMTPQQSQNPTNALTQAVTQGMV